MRLPRGTSSSFTTVVSLGALYLTVVILTSVLSRELLRGTDVLYSRFTVLLAGLGLLFAVVLLGAVVFKLAQLHREQRRRVPGSTLKSRLSVFFTLVVVLSAVPQGVVSVSFLSAGLETLFASGTGAAISEGLDLSLRYYDRLVYDLEQVAADGTLERIVAEELPASPERVFQRLHRRLPLLAAVQSYDAGGETLFFMGQDRLYRDGTFLPFSGTASLVSRLNVAGEGFLRLVKTLEEPADTVVVLTTSLPRGFETTARNLTDARATFERLEQLRPAFVWYVSLIYAMFAAPILLMAVLASFFLASRIMRPIESLEEATRRVAEGDYSVRILGRPNDDLGLLVISFNNMVGDLDQARRRMKQAEKVQAWQEIAQRLAHEVKNPLTPIRLAAERLRRRYSSGAEDFGSVLDRTVDTIIREVDALSALLNEFRSFARMPRPAREPVSLRVLVEQAVGVFREDPRITIDTGGIPPELTISVDAKQIRQVVINLVSNAVEATDDTVLVRFRTDVVRRTHVTYCRLRVEDDGPGIPAELGKTVFDPYTTSKREGTGLGLAIVERIVFDHDGQISFESAPGSGTTFILDLPMVEEGRLEV